MPRFSGFFRAPRRILPGHGLSIRFQLICLVAVCVVPVWFVLGLLVSHAFQAKRALVTQNMLEMSRSLSMVVDRELASVQAALTALATSPSFASGDLAAIHGQARKLLSSYPEADIIVSDARGQQLVNSYRPFGVPLPRRTTPETVRRIFAGARPVVSDLYRGALTGRPLIAIDIPVFRQGRVAYDLSMTFPSSRLTSILSHQGLSGGRFGAILDGKGVVVAKSWGASSFVGHPGCAMMRNAMARSASGVVRSVSLEGTPVFLAFTRTSLAGWTVVIGVPEGEVTGELRRWLAWTLIGALLFSLAGVALALLVGRSIARSIRSLIAPAAALGRGAPLESVQRSGLREVDEVSQTLILAAELARERLAERDRAQELAHLGSYVYSIPEDRCLTTETTDSICGIDAGYERTRAGWLKIIHPAHRREMDRYLREVIEQRTLFDREFPVVRINDGAVRWLHMLGRVECGDDGAPLRMAGTLHDITERRQAEDELRAYARRIMDVEENLRKIVAAELHDEIGRDLTVIGINLSIIARSLPPETEAPLRTRVEDSARVLETISRTVRNIMATLRPPVLDDYGLAATLRWYGELFSRRTGVAVSVQVGDDFPRLSAGQEIALFRIAQEALTNVSKHAAARNVALTLELDDGMLSFAVADDGRGGAGGQFSRGRESSGWGVTIMRERAELFGGMLRLDSPRDGGTTIFVQMPKEEP